MCIYELKKRRKYRGKVIHFDIEDAGKMLKSYGCIHIQVYTVSQPGRHTGQAVPI
jgi:hypothetical protein